MAVDLKAAELELWRGLEQVVGGEAGRQLVEQIERVSFAIAKTLIEGASPAILRPFEELILNKAADLAISETDKALQAVAASAAAPAPAPAPAAKKASSPAAGK